MNSYESISNLITKTPIRLYATPKAVITRYLSFSKERIGHVVSRVINLVEEDAEMYYQEVMLQFAGRHHNLEDTFIEHFSKVNEPGVMKETDLSQTKQLLIGALFTMEYSIMAAALFNPSIVEHPDQNETKPGETRFIVSMRATGEGHISSIVFQTGIIAENGDIVLDEMPLKFFRLKKATVSWNHQFTSRYTNKISGFNNEIFSLLPDPFTELDVTTILSNQQHVALHVSAEKILQVTDTNYELFSPPGLPLNERVIFPNSRAESMGMEDVRFVKFMEDGNSIYYGTYTAYNGKEIKTMLIETADFNVFKIRSLAGSAIADKGMALFPEKINGRYAMVSRQGGELISIMFSDDLYTWDKYETLMEPKFIWEFVQLGNCGSPVKTDAGWLLLTHGVGPMRTYVISAILLDLNDPVKIIGRLDRPLIHANQEEREGYVPNVVYTCGLLRHGDILIIPYAVSDSATGFVTVRLVDLLNQMKN